jgi:hypothetical protein
MPAPLRARTHAEAEAADAGEVQQEPAAAFAPSERVPDPDPLVALGVRVPRSLDDRLAVLGVQLRVRGVRLTKAELVAYALRQLPTSVTDKFAAAVRP